MRRGRGRYPGRSVITAIRIAGFESPIIVEGGKSIRDWKLKVKPALESHGAQLQQVAEPSSTIPGSAPAPAPHEDLAPGSAADGVQDRENPHARLSIFDTDDLAIDDMFVIDERWLAYDPWALPDDSDNAQ